MSPARQRYYRVLYAAAAVYDLTLGIVFLFLARPVFTLLGVQHAMPAYGAYLSLIAVFLFVIGVAYLLIARGDLVRNVDLIAVGTLYKLAYTAVAAYYLAVGDYPHLVFISVFGLADLIFLVLMAESWSFVRRQPPDQTSRPARA